MTGRDRPDGGGSAGGDRPAEWPEPSLAAYRFDEYDADSLDDLREAFEWEIPDTLNAATYLCDRWAAHDGDRLAMVAVDEAGDRERLTYADLRARADRLAAFLRARGVERGDRVAITAEQRASTVVGFVATWKLGGVVVPLSPKFGTGAVEHRLADCGVAACVVTEPNLAAVRAAATGAAADTLGPVLVVGTDPRGDETAYARAERGPDDGREAIPREAFETVATDPDDPALVLYTSGTTGEPKGVCHGHHTVLGMLPTYALSMCNLDLDAGHVAWMPAAWGWIASLQYTLPVLYYGHTILGDVAERFDPERTMRLFAEHGVTVAFVGPALSQLRASVDDPSRYGDLDLRVAMTGSYHREQYEWLRETFPGVEIHRSYGQTEATLPVGTCSALYDAPLDSVGRPMPGHDLRVVDPDTGEAQPPGEAGELVVRYDGDPACFDGYWKREAAMADTVRDGWLRTDDLARMDEDGNIFFMGRRDDVINCSGYRVGPGEIESILSGHDAVDLAGVIGIPDADRGEVPKAFIALADGVYPSEELIEALQERVREEYALYAYPRAIEIVDDLPQTRNGKVRRVELREREGLGADGD